MKRIMPSYPVDELRGKLAGRQKLEYAENNNPAYESPKGQRNYARNYKTCLVACKRASDGKQYFQIRTKSSVNMTAKAVKAMALMGGTGAMVGYILAHKTSELYAACYAQWLELQSLGSKKTFRKSLSDVIMAGLKDKSVTIVFAGPRGNVNIDNPWNTSSVTPNVVVSNAVLVKFWSELAANPVTFTVDGETGVAHRGETDAEAETFANIIASNHNVLNLSASENQTSGHYLVKKGSKFVCFDSENVTYSAVADRTLFGQLGISGGAVLSYDLADMGGQVWDD